MHSYLVPIAKVNKSTGTKLFKEVNFRKQQHIVQSLEKGSIHYTVHRAYGGCGNTIRFSRGYISNPMHTRHCNLTLTPLPILFYDTVLQYLYLVPVLNIEHFCWLVGLRSKIFEITLKFSNPRGCMLKIGENSYKNPGKAFKHRKIRRRTCAT